MAKQSITRKKRVKKGEIPKGTHLCPSCGGRGYKNNVGRPPSK